LNCAHQGPLPTVAVSEAREAIAWKVAPFHLTTERFSGVPKRLRQALALLIDAAAEDIILGNSASYGLHLLANGIRWRAGDEVLLMKGDFPSDILPWLALRDKGVKVRLIQPRNHVLQADELLENITHSTKLFCTTLVHSFSGFAIDASALGEVCRAHGVLFVLNTSQALGTRPFSILTTPVDAITNVGHKWLCGPYSTGFCWMKPELRESLEYNQAYWLAMQTADDLANEQNVPALRPDLGARQYDVFGTANFFNFKPWAASVEYLLAQRIENIAAHNYKLISRWIEELDMSRYELLSPRDGAARSTLVFISARQPQRNGEIYAKLLKEKVFVAQRAGKLRISPHLYNTFEDIDQALAILNSA
ncbi:aminotransferase class V-fold PLP-dependent enzyme, partial [bacterium]|nr:aminotransferase class V-fold PLP-dependent enzyme [bacterium]